MTNIENSYKRAGQFFYLSSALHVVAILVSAGGLFAQLFPAAILWALVGYGLINKGWRWLAYLGFIGALIGIVASITLATGNTGLTRIAMYSITLADLGAALLLFVALWRNPQET